MTIEKLRQLYEAWEDDKSNYDPVESSDNYFWAGASSFRDFLEKNVAEDFSMNVEESWLLSRFLQERMTDKESIEEIGLLATRLYHFCRENPLL